MTERPPRPPRAEPREVSELKALRTTHPELASAIDMQLALVEVQRRVQARVPLPWIQPDPAWLAAQRASGLPAVRFADIPLDWTDFRLTFRQTVDVLHRFGAVDAADQKRLHALAREGNVLEPIVAAWYTKTTGGGAEEPSAEAGQIGQIEGLDHVLVLALRPFLARCAEALSQRADFSSWQHGNCPFCGWEPELAVITGAAERRLICGRCLAQWSFDSQVCPFCGNADRSRTTSFATRDGRYQVSGCNICKRYLKAYDARKATRPVMPAVDTIATLPLDAAAIQRGYQG